METQQQYESLQTRFLDGFQLVISDAQDLLRGAGRELDEAYKVARSVAESTVDSASDAFEITDQYVQEHPWQTISVGALAGLAVGLWLGRR